MVVTDDPIRPASSTEVNDTVQGAYDSAGSDASTATDLHDQHGGDTEVQGQQHTSDDIERVDTGGLSASEWEVMQQKLAVQALRMGDFKALARITSQMALHSKQIAAVSKQPSTITAPTGYDILQGSTTAQSEINEVEKSSRVHSEVVDDGQIATNNAPTVRRARSNGTNSETSAQELRPDSYQASDSAAPNLVDETSDIRQLAGLMEKGESSAEAVDQPARESTKAQKLPAMMHKNKETNIALCAAQDSENLQINEEIQPSSSCGTSAPVESDTTPSGETAIVRLASKGSHAEAEAPAGSEMKITESIVAADSGRCESKDDADAVALLLPIKPFSPPIDETNEDHINCEEKSDGMNDGGDDHSIKESEFISEENAMVIEGDEDLKVARDELVISPQGITFTMLLLKTLEEEAATSREQTELNSYKKGMDIRDHAALLKWRSEQYNAVSCLCLPMNNALRRRCCSLMEWKWFDRIIMMNIALNCFFMAMEDPNTRKEENSYNEMLHDAGIFFQFVFTSEAVIKIIARGFLVGKKAYLRDGWNVLDFFTVILGLLEYIVVTLGASTSVLRTFRLVRPLRALRAVGRFKDLRMIVNLIISCLPLLVDVFALISFIFMVFGIIAVQLWGGYLRGRCYHIDDGTLDQSNIDQVCAPGDGGGMRKCAATQMCLNLYMNPFYDALTFDYIGAVLIIIFQIMIQQKWAEMMYYTWDCFSIWSWPFFIFLNLVGPMFAVQLFLVVVANQYSDAKALQREAEKAAVELFEVKVGAVTANLPRLSRSGHSVSFDPYVQMSVDEKMKKTRVIKNCSVPEWNEYFVFPVSAAASCAKIELRNWKRQGAHEIIGVLTIPVGVLDQSEEGTDRWYEICAPEGVSMEGSIRIRTQWRMIATDEWSPLPEIDDEDMPEEEDAEDEDLSYFGFIQLYFRMFAESKFLNIVSILFICGNTLGMASDHSCDIVQDPGCKIFKAQLEQANLAFTSFFALEMLIKVWGMGPMTYFKDISNFFDFSVTVISLVEVPSSILQINCYASPHTTPEALEQCASAGGALSVLRSFRLVRILRLGKLLEFFPQIRRQLKVIRRTLGAVSSLVLLIMMYLVIFAILGMSILGGNVTEYLRTTDPDNVNDFRPGNYVRILIPGDPLMISTAKVIGYDGLKSSRQYLVQHYSESNYKWPLTGMTNASIEQWKTDNLYWLDAEEVEPFQYPQVARRNEILIVALVPRGNFDSFFNAIITVFQIFTTSNLGDAMYPSIRGTNMFAALFFAVQILIGNLLLFNLFTGIIITGFSETKEELQREENENQKMIEQDRLRRAQSLARGASVSSRGGRQASVTRGHSIASSIGGERCSSAEAIYNHIKSRLFGSNRVTAEELKRSAVVPSGSANNNEEGVEEVPRNIAYRIVSHRFFEGFILFAIAISSAGLAIHRPGMGPEEYYVIQIVETAVGLVFVIECVLKIRGLGFFRYIGSRWNQLDFFLVLTTSLDLIIEWFASSNKISFFSTLKVMRALRPLRVISRMKRLKDTFTTITRAFIPVMNTVAIAMCVFFIFAIMAVQLLGGALSFCTDPFIVDKKLCVGINPATNQTRDWESRRITYDWIGSAVQSMFILASQDNWENAMFSGIDATTSNAGPYVNNKPIISLFFLSYMIVGSFFVVQLFVGVFIDTFQTVIAERKAMSRQSSIASENTDISNAQNMREPTEMWRLLVYDVVTQKPFDMMIAAYIILNILLMASEAYKQSSVQSQIIVQGNFVFSFVFGTEIILKLFAFRAKYYFISGWNKFDFFVVTISYVGIALDLLGSLVPMNPAIVRIFRVFRIFRILRAFRIFRAAQRLQNLIRTLVRSLKEVANLGILLLLLFFVTAVMVVEIFGRMCMMDFDPAPVPGKLDRCNLVDERNLVDPHATFVNAGISLLTLFRICTGDNWSDIMGSTSLSPGIRPSSNATTIALNYLMEYNRTGRTDALLLAAARNALPICQTREELDHLGSIISCEDEDIVGFCASTCGDRNLASLIFTVFLFGSQFVLLNLVMAVLMRELSSAISSSARKHDNQTSASISVLLSVNQATNTWLRRASLTDGDPGEHGLSLKPPASTDSGSEKQAN